MIGGEPPRGFDPAHGGRKRWRVWLRPVLHIAAMTPFWVSVAHATPVRADDDLGSNLAEEPFSTGSSSWQGYSEFVRLAQDQLGKERVILSKHINYNDLTQADTLLIIHPEQRLDSASVSEFLVNGGRVGIFDDYGRGADFLRAFGILSEPAPTSPAEQLQDNPNLAVATPTIQVAAGAKLGRHPITLGVERVVTNHPRVFQHPDLTAVLDIVDRQGAPHTLLLTGIIAQKGRLLALGDPSVFINFMMRYPSNRKLASGVLLYLTESKPNPQSPDPKAARLFILTNHFDQTGQFGSRRRLLDRLDELYEGARASLEQLQGGALNRELILFMATLTMVWIVASHTRRMLRLPSLTRTTYALPPVLAAQVGAAGRLDVLSSNHAAPVLSVLELDGVLRDAIARRLGVDSNLNPKQLKIEVERAGVPAEQADQLEQVLRKIELYGRSLSRGKTPKIKQIDLIQLHDGTLQLLKTIETSKLIKGADRL